MKVIGRLDIFNVDRFSFGQMVLKLIPKLSNSKDIFSKNDNMAIKN